MSALWWLTALVPLGVLALVLVNLVFWPRGRKEAQAPSFSVLIPARNEANTIERSVRAALAAAPEGSEVIVYDDASTDQTPQILERLQMEHTALRVLKGRGLPKGWAGKPHACHQLAQAARRSMLLFVDADVELFGSGLRRVASLFEDYSADLVTAVPRQITVSPIERLVLPLLHLTYTAWLFLPLIWRSRDPRFLAANGQLLAVHKSTYEALGGYAAVRGALVDDMALCKHAKISGRRVVFADGFRMARCRMYSSAREVVAGFSKNIFEGLGASFFALAVVVALYLFTFVWPYVALFFTPLALVGVGANLIVRALLAARFSHPFSSALLHPLGVLALVGIALNSMRLFVQGRVEWRGRVYPRAKVARSGGS